MVSIGFVTTCLLLIVVPGPSFAVVVDRGLRHGRVCGFAAVAGNSSGLCCWATASVLGLTALIAASDIAFIALKVAGAGYLCWLGIGSLRRRASDSSAGDSPRAGGGRVAAHRTAAPPSRLDVMAAFRCGLVTNLANPKAAVLYLALLPEFVGRRAGLDRVLLLASVQITLSIAWYTIITLGVAAAHTLLARPRMRRWLGRVSGCVLIGLGARLLTVSRPLT